MACINSNSSLPEWPEKVENSTDPSWKTNVKESLTVVNKVGEIENCTEVASVADARNPYVKFLSGHLKRYVHRIIFG